MRKLMIALAAGTVLALSPMFAEEADARRGGGGFSGARVGGIGGARIGGIGGARIGGIGGARVGAIGVGRGIGWAGRGVVGPRVAAFGGHGLRHRHFHGHHHHFHRHGFGWGWGAPLAFGVGVGIAASCTRWDPYYGWVNVCAAPGYGYGYYGGQWW